MDKYVAFFRGLNISGRNTLKMIDLKRVLESIGCHNVKTILASGNALFSAPHSAPKTLKQKIESVLREKHGYKGNVILRAWEDIDALFSHAPFSKENDPSHCKLFVTFLPTPIENHPSVSMENLQIIHTTPSEIFSALTMQPETRTVDMMSLFDTVYGKDVTTRTWATLEKIRKAAEQ